MTGRKDIYTDVLPTRLTLLQRAQSESDDAVWEDLLRYYEPFIRKILLRMGLRAEDLEDARQQVSLTLWKGLSSYSRDQGGSRFRNWLSTLIHNAAIDWLRVNRRQCGHMVPLDETAADLIYDGESEVLQIIEAEWKRYVVRLALDNLRGVFTGHAFEVLELSLQGYTGDEIAERLGIRKESVYVLRNRVKVRLSREIAHIRLDLEGGEAENGQLPKSLS